MIAEDEIDSVADRLHRGCAELVLFERRRKSCREQQRVLFSKREPELLREHEDHLSTRLCATGFDVAEVPRRNAGVERESKLAEVPCASPVGVFGNPPAHHLELACDEASASV